MSGKRLALAALMALVLVALGSRQVVVFAQETDDPVKIEIYKRFVDNRINKPGVAYQAARDYLQPVFAYGPPRLARLGFEFLF